MIRKNSIFSNRKLIMFFLFMIIILPLFEPYLKSQEGLSELFKIEEGQEFLGLINIILGVIIVVFGVIAGIQLLKLIWIILRNIYCGIRGYCPPPFYIFW